ncbi:hypothetical protein GPNCGGLF_LOCUS262 [Methylorubrum aminovorans]
MALWTLLTNITFSDIGPMNILRLQCHRKSRPQVNFSNFCSDRCSTYALINSGLAVQEQPVVEPQVSHFRQVPLRTSVKFAHSGQASPT